MKSLKQTVQEYIRMRRHLGFKMRHEERRLRRFVSFMELHNASYITTRLALKWATEPADAQRATWAQRLMCVRVFARYCSGADPRTEVCSATIRMGARDNQGGRGLRGERMMTLLFVAGKS